MYREDGKLKVLKFMNMILFVLLILVTPNMLIYAESIQLKSVSQLQGIKIERSEKKEDGKEVGDGIRNENVIVEEQAISIQKDENVAVDDNYKTGAGLGSDICFVFAGLLSLLIIVALVCWKKLLRIRPFQ